jgi:hypothetical protein
MCLAGEMRCPDRIELEFAMLAFVALGPLGYYTIRFVIELI